MKCDNSFVRKEEIMNHIFKSYLFTKGILVNSVASENCFAARFTLANKFNISITKGAELAHEDMISFVAEMLGEHVPAAFYRGFPKSVRSLSKDALLFDQLLHYFNKDGAGDFSEAGHSLLEEEFARTAFKESAEIKKFVIITEDEAVTELEKYVGDMLKGTRPLNKTSYDVVMAFVEEYKYEVKDCACKDTAIKLLVDTGECKYARFLFLSDVIKLVDYINYERYDNTNIRKLNFRNSDRKLVTKVINEIFKSGYRNVKECFEKKAIWCGLLHHIHYQAKCDEAEKFVQLMRGKENHSVYSEFERAMTLKDIEKAVTCLREGKGSGALLRSLNYIVSRCESEEEIDFVINSINTENALILIQLIMQYSHYTADCARTFKFIRHNMLNVHKETDEEVNRRKSSLNTEQVNKLLAAMQRQLAALLRARLGKVYVSPDMYSMALPIQEAASNGGYGILPKGSRIRLEEGKKVRAFTYWEKVNDIDLSVIGIRYDGGEEEFSWRTMFNEQSEEIVYSGDQTSGYYGGTEYFDINTELFKKNNPEIRYLVFCNNVFSGKNFSDCICKAGYMLRDVDDTGEIFEPKTVKTSFVINCDSTYAYLFGIDLETNDFVWINTACNSDEIIAGESSLSFLSYYFNTTSVMNVGKLFEMLASELVASPDAAEVIVSNEEMEVREEVEVVRSCDFEKINAYLNLKK